jgi:hypothetical protein
MMKLEVSIPNEFDLFIMVLPEHAIWDDFLIFGMFVFVDVQNYLYGGLSQSRWSKWVTAAAGESQVMLRQTHVVVEIAGRRSASRERLNWGGPHGGGNGAYL